MNWFVKRLEDVPVAPADEPGDPVWYPVQHHFGLTAFGANAYVARAAGDELLGEHDETGSGQEELYVVIAGRARFTLDGEDVDVGAVSVVAVPDPAVLRSALALEAGTSILAVGGEPRAGFRSTWNERHFERVPRA